MHYANRCIVALILSFQHISRCKRTVRNRARHWYRDFWKMLRFICRVATQQQHKYSSPFSRALNCDWHGVNLNHFFFGNRRGEPIIAEADARRVWIRLLRRINRLVKWLRWNSLEFTSSRTNGQYEKFLRWHKATFICHAFVGLLEVLILLCNLF